MFQGRLRFETSPFWTGSLIIAGLGVAVLLAGGACCATGLAVFSGILSGLGLGLAGTGLDKTPAIGVTSRTRTVTGCNADGGSRPVKEPELQLFHKGSTSKTFEGNARIGR